eukprot:Em0001g498a
MLTVNRPVAAIARVLAIIQESGPPLGLNINIAKCELFSSRDLSSFPEAMRRSNVPHFEILGAPIGDLVFCAKFVAQKQSEASKLLKELEAVGSIDPQVALLLLSNGSSFVHFFPSCLCLAVSHSLPTAQPPLGACGVGPRPKLPSLSFLSTSGNGLWGRIRFSIPPADVLVPNWDLGKPAAFELSVTSTLEASVTAGSC